MKTIFERITIIQMPRTRSTQRWITAWRRPILSDSSSKKRLIFWFTISHKKRFRISSFRTHLHIFKSEPRRCKIWPLNGYEELCGSPFLGHSMVDPPVCQNPNDLTSLRRTRSSGSNAPLVCHSWDTSFGNTWWWWKYQCLEKSLRFGLFPTTQ